MSQIQTAHRAINLVRQQGAAVTSRAVTGWLVAGAFLLFSVPINAFARGAPETFADLVDKTRPAVVSIAAIKTVNTGNPRSLPYEIPEGPMQDWFKEFLDKYNQDRGRRGNGKGRRRMAVGEGSGFFLTSDGYVVTNNHVVENAEKIQVVTVDGDQFEAELVGRDEKTDLALLRIKDGDNFPSLAWGDSEDSLNIGDWVMAIGNPRGLGGSVSAGIVSQKARNISRGAYDFYIQTDAAINPGNSGGPLVSMDGRVVGVNTLIYSGQGGSDGLGFSIPAHRAKLVIDQLREFGEVRRGWLGVTFQPVNASIAESLNLDETRGAIVMSISPGSPAEDGKIMEGDVILSFDGNPINREGRLPWIVAKTPIGKRVPVEVWRDESAETLYVTVAQLDEAVNVAMVTDGTDAPTEPVNNELTLDNIGLSMTGVNALLREELNLPENISGVLITNVEDLSSAQESGLREGDIIAEVNQQKVESLDNLSELVEKAEADERTAVLVKVWRDGRSLYIGLPLEG